MKTWQRIQWVWGIPLKMNVYHRTSCVGGLSAWMLFVAPGIVYKWLLDPELGVPLIVVRIQGSNEVLHYLQHLLVSVHSSPLQAG